MSRSKSISEEQLLDRLTIALIDHSPSKLTFRKATKAAGLSAATLVQRFQSRDGMVQAILLRLWDRLDEATAAADAKVPMNFSGAIDLLMELTTTDRAHHHFANELTLLREDVRNPILRKRGHDWSLALVGAVGRRLSHHQDQATLLGWQMVSLWQGALIWSAFHNTDQPNLMIRRILQDWSNNVVRLVKHLPAPSNPDKLG